MIASGAIVVAGFHAIGSAAAWRRSRKVLQSCTEPVAPATSAQAGSRLDTVSPAIVTDAVFKNSLREPLAIVTLPFQAQPIAICSATKLYSHSLVRSNGVGR